MQCVLIFVEQVFVVEPYQLRDIGVSSIELAHIIPRCIAFIFAQRLITLDHRTEHSGQPSKGCGILIFICLRCHELVESLHIVHVVEHIIADLIAQVIDLV